MFPKKNPKADLSKNSTLYFLIGLVLVLFVTWRLLEFKTYERSYDIDILNVMSDDDEEVPIIEQIKTPPPPPAVAPQVIEVAEDEDEVEETVIESTESDQDDIVEVENVEVEDAFEEVDVPFAIIEDVPIFPGCEEVAKSKRRDCFQEKMNKHIVKNFRYPDIAQEMGIQGRVYVKLCNSYRWLNSGNKNAWTGQKLRERSPKNYIQAAQNDTRKTKGKTGSGSF